MRSSIQLLIVIAAFGAGVVRAQDEAQAEEWPRFHFGVAVSSPNDWSVDISEAGVPFPDPILAGDRSGGPDTGWKLVTGFRPLRVVGVEFQYVEFAEGETGVYGGFSYGGRFDVWQQETEMKVNTQARVLSAVLFIPEASPNLDIYGKVGVADVDESISASAIVRVTGVPEECAPGGFRERPTGPCLFTSDLDESDSAPYVGIGARFRIGSAAAIRVEYEAIDRDGGDRATMFSLGIAWEH